MGKPRKRQQKIKIGVIDNEIKNAMNEYKNERNCYVMISKKLGKEFTPKQIRQRWLSHLDPSICHEELNDDERSYITKWVKEHKSENSSDKICWTKLISEMHDEFGKLRSENKVKNFYYLKERQRRFTTFKR
ncbi:hypothetical protein RclHR1_04840012 [Rhizophagus clarus]|uniref:HTH myb-type domain-containing protein n=1 Tax=Rhizophagus clarus TaxID=94130 RepID=A0A2Z6SDC6_9GLOM|nr:hypothetical protein RclHR1_04840012 [Rhizophagus clarus]GET03658.1 hypothetical protein GLOIN_2v1781289 [Rhizophagus clarus]